MLCPDTVERSDDLIVWIASPGLSCDAQQSTLREEGAEPTKGGRLKEVDARLDLLIIIVSRPDFYQPAEER